MPHDVSLIATIAAAFGLAMIFGFIAVRLRMPPLVGYLLAGIVISPATPGFVADVGLASQLAEIGVMLLMFGVGLHFSIKDLMAVRRIAVPGAIVQIAVATLLGIGLSHFWGWSLAGSLVFGLCLSVASTVVLLRALEAKGLLKSINGQIAVGWLVVEDLVMVMVLVLLPALAGVIAPAEGVAATSGSDIWQAVGLTLAKVTAFIVLMLVVGRRLLPKALWWVARTGSQELFTLSVVAVAVGVAFGAGKLFDVSFALGAFFAGMMMRESEFAHRAADESLPLRDAFAVLFFVSVGMLFDPAVVWNEPLKLLAVVAIIMLGKTACGGGAGAAVPLPAQHRTDRGCEPGADRRVLVHPRRPGRGAQPDAGGGPEPGAGGRAHFDCGQLGAVLGGGAAAGLGARTLGLCPQARSARRPAGRAARVHPCVAAGQTGGAGGPRPGGRAHRADLARARHPAWWWPKKTARSSTRCARTALRR